MKHVIFLANDDFPGICLEGRRASDLSHNTRPVCCSSILLQDQIMLLFQSSFCSHPQTTGLFRTVQTEQSHLIKFSAFNKNWRQIIYASYTQQPLMLLIKRNSMVWIFWPILFFDVCFYSCWLIKTNGIYNVQKAIWRKKKTTWNIAWQTH